MREKLQRAEAALARVEKVALAGFLGLMTALAFAQVVLRRLDMGLLWADTLLKQLVLWTGFLGAALAANAEKHFAWDAAQTGAPASLKPWLRLFASLAAAAVCTFLLKAALVYVAGERSGGDILFSVGVWRVPSWVAACGIPGGFALVIIHFLFKSFDAAAQLGAKS